MSLNLEIITDYACPWCYLSSARTRRLREAYDLSLSYVLFPLHPDVPKEGLALSELFRGRGLDLAAMHQAMKARMDEEGLEYGPRDRTFNTRLAQELAKWAEQSGKPEIHDALYRAYFVGGKNVGEPAELVKIAAGLGLPADEAEGVLADRTFRDAVDSDWARARELGVTGVPTFIAANRAVVGAQPYEVLERLVQQAGAKPRPAQRPG